MQSLLGIPTSTLDRKRCALLVHTGYLFSGTPGTGELPVVEDTIGSLLTAARVEGVPIFHLRPPTSATLPGPDAHLIGRRDRLVTTWRDDPFTRTDLDDQLGAECDQLVLAGGYAHRECLATATRAKALGRQPLLVGDAVVDTDVESLDLTCRYIASRLGTVIEATSIIAAWSGIQLPMPSNA